MKYFSRKTSLYSPKNKLQKAVLDQMDRYTQYMIVSAQAFIDDLKIAVEGESKSYPNCRPLTVRSRQVGEDICVDVMVNCSYNETVCSFMLHSVKGEFWPVCTELQEGGNHV